MFLDVGERWYRILRYYAQLDADPENLSRTGYHWVIVGFAAALGLLGALIWLALYLRVDPVKLPLVAAVLMPASGCLLGILLGVSLSCAVAPRSFMFSPAGRKWLKLVGTRKVFWGRAVCVLAVLPLAAVQAFFAVAAIMVRA